MRYTVVFDKSKEQFPTDFLQYHFDIEDQDYIESNDEDKTETWEFEVEDDKSDMFENACDDCHTVLSYKAISKKGV
jgi:hypothetical protein